LKEIGNIRSMKLATFGVAPRSDVAFWHFSDMPQRPDDVRSRG
jgi:hypothetical protein